MQDLQAGDIISWTIVSGIHKVRSGIYHRNGRLISLLTDFGRINPCYPDFHGTTENTIFYTGAGRRGDQKLDPANRALLGAVGKNVGVPLFNKLAVGQWEYLGLWSVTASSYVMDETHERMVWKFELTRAVEQ